MVQVYYLSLYGNCFSSFVAKGVKNGHGLNY